MTASAMLKAMIVICAYGAVLLSPAVADEARPRLLVLTDIGGDPDGHELAYRWWIYEKMRLNAPTFSRR